MGIWWFSDWESDGSVIPDDSRCLIKTGLSEKPFAWQMFCGWTPTLVKAHFLDVGRPRSSKKMAILKWSPAQRSSYVQWTKHLLVIPCMLPVVMFLSPRKNETEVQSFQSSCKLTIFIPFLPCFLGVIVKIRHVPITFSPFVGSDDLVVNVLRSSTPSIWCCSASSWPRWL